jgi:hypothetical protein
MSASNDTAYGVIAAVSLSHLLNDTLQSLLPAIYPVLKSTFDLRVPAGDRATGGVSAASEQRQRLSPKPDGTVVPSAQSSLRKATMSASSWGVSVMPANRLNMNVYCSATSCSVFDELS